MEKRILDKLLLRGFNEKTLLNNRGLIGATIESIDAIEELEIERYRIWILIDEYRTNEDGSIDTEIDTDLLYRIIFKKL
jgi:hypothetical protein